MPLSWPIVEDRNKVKELGRFRDVKAIKQEIIGCFKAELYSRAIADLDCDEFHICCLNG